MSKPKPGEIVCEICGNPMDPKRIEILAFLPSCTVGERTGRAHLECVQKNGITALRVVADFKVAEAVDGSR